MPSIYICTQDSRLKSRKQDSTGLGIQSEKANQHGRLYQTGILCTLNISDQRLCIIQSDPIRFYLLDSPCTKGYLVLCKDIGNMLIHAIRCNLYLSRNLDDMLKTRLTLLSCWIQHLILLQCLSVCLTDRSCCEQLSAKRSSVALPVPVASGYWSGPCNGYDTDTNGYDTGLNTNGHEYVGH